MNEETIFLEAVAIGDPAERRAYLSRACAGNAALEHQIAALLAAHERSGEFLRSPALQQVARGASAESAKLGETGVERQVARDAHEVDLSFLQPTAVAGSLGKLGHYEVQEIIGRGGCGIVLKAFDETLHRVVAIKVLAPELALTSPARKRFLREARAAAAIRHENVISIYAVEDQPLPFLVMEYIAGQTLQEKLDQTGPLEIGEVVQIGQQLARGLEAAHALGLIHRDIKPANILLEKGRNCVKLTDFGLARTADDASVTQSGTIAGTPLYMSPEQAQGEAIDQRSDLFSLGSVLYVMCAGRPPFRAATTLAVLKRVTEDEPRPIREIIPEVPEWLIGLIARLHAKKPADRCSSAQEVANLLAHPPAESDAVANGPASSAGRVSQTAAAKRAAWEALPARGRRWFTTAAILFVVLLAGLSLTEASGVTNLRGTVVRLFASDKTVIVDVERHAPDKPEAVPAAAATLIPPAGNREGTVVIGQWEMTDEGLIQHDTGRRFPVLFFGDPSWRDYDFSVEAMRIEGNDQFALNFRANDSGSLYWFGVAEWGNTVLQLGAKKNGDHVFLKQKLAIQNHHWYTAQARVRGTHITCSLSEEGKLLHQFEFDDNRHAYGRVGLRTCCSAVRFRNIKVTAPDGTILWEGPPDLPGQAAP